MAVHVLTDLATALVTSGINVLVELADTFDFLRQAPSEYRVNVELVATLHSESEYSTESTDDDVAVMNVYSFTLVRKHLFKE